ncbi:MAG TPA: hypothetical protein PLP29_04670 [Candidatus Ozemobacteraceae bacterium]|nr:hypothetical protein [Candidatus Ozemobacteraceae bacterium]
MKTRTTSTPHPRTPAGPTRSGRGTGAGRPGRSPTAWEKEWRGLLVDKELDDGWLEALNHLSGMRLTSICAGHPGRNGRREQPAHIVVQLGAHLGSGPGADPFWNPLLLDLSREFVALPGMAATRIRLHQELTVRDGMHRNGPSIRILLTLDCPAPRRNDPLSPEIRAWFETACAGLARLDHRIAPAPTGIAN